VGKQKLPRIDRLWKRDKGICWICVEPASVIVCNQDHLIPKSLGGTDGFWNIRLSHIACNTKRGQGQEPPPLIEVLRYCPTVVMQERAKRLYYVAYPHRVTEDGLELVLDREKSGPYGHRRYSSSVCHLCHTWCGTCDVCWCTATAGDHDVLKIHAGWENRMRRKRVKA